ncbi:hypothetical protein HBI56_093690 [Parastagonospora nodorum]|nr:hypothetical protein HBH50_004970 [Parastagonospora nodorum]KAH4096146.1 hypothetical protein HBH48_052850 [Parastagonospora nodorum]KAH4350327.1 hypothetical protein HBH98_047650 [Parastagonospora nodorum]KAH4380296.1 hypothetical protein HBH97_094210 [Parastagonospora nodorum]KAH4425035.1 hypothetical protein HBH99_035240 [Parastagonospora nodorum]
MGCKSSTSKVLLIRRFQSRIRRKNGLNLRCVGVDFGSRGIMGIYGRSCWKHFRIQLQDESVHLVAMTMKRTPDCLRFTKSLSCYIVIDVVLNRL